MVPPAWAATALLATHLAILLAACVGTRTVALGMPWLNALLYVQPAQLGGLLQAVALRAVALWILRRG